MPTKPGDVPVVEGVHSDVRLPKAEGGLFLHCGRCFREKPPSRSAEEYARLSVARTAHGLQVWCVRHNINVALVEVYWGDDAPSCDGCAVCKPE